MYECIIIHLPHTYSIFTYNVSNNVFLVTMDTYDIFYDIRGIIRNM